MVTNFPIISWLTAALSAGVTLIAIYWLNEKSAKHPTVAKVALTTIIAALLTLFFHFVVSVEIFH